MKIPSRLRRASAEGGEGSSAQQAGGQEGFGERGGTQLVGSFEHDYGRSRLVKMGRSRGAMLPAARTRRAPWKAAWQTIMRFFWMENDYLFSSVRKTYQP
jgi:hypothetical protein